MTRMRVNNYVVDMCVLEELGGKDHRHMSFIPYSAHKNHLHAECALLPSPKLPQHSQLELCNFALFGLSYPFLLHWHCCQHHTGVFAGLALLLLGWHLYHCFAGVIALVMQVAAQLQCHLQHRHHTWCCHCAHHCYTQHHCW